MNHLVATSNPLPISPAVTNGPACAPWVRVQKYQTREATVIVLGIILIVVGWLLGIGLLETIGLVLAVIGLILLLLHGTGHSVGGRVWY